MGSGWPKVTFGNCQAHVRCWEGILPDFATLIMCDRGGARQARRADKAFFGRFDEKNSMSCDNKKQ
jgi:hypothetical protein